MSNRDHVFTVNNIYSVLWWSSLLTNCFQEHSAAHVSHRCITSATSNNVMYLFGAIKVYPSLKAFAVKYRPLPLEKRLLELVILSVAIPIALKDDDQHLDLGGVLRSKQAITDMRILDHHTDVVVKDTVSMVVEISYLQLASYWWIIKATMRSSRSQWHIQD
ncbi:hypothetical protein O0I10_003147 [Lichtheimia ornata]|uniref:Uncharacterized protein n=1 Tax=Lichtheimia ornata TaxID=688661 RepID=A0AAD7V8M2_9FUNG|nr:uncharacterized protein O0I10_003147 [Lichtheimia ornata]KAJ8660925.1 hypothetical protein O0I10_003147 [Lichtheimia ornata]